jgi:DNA-binding NarL/FixJ family response regulator
VKPVSSCVLVIQGEPGRRRRWTAALERAGHGVIARSTVVEGQLVLAAARIDAVVVETPPGHELAHLLDAAPGDRPPPILLIGAPYGEVLGVPRAGAAALCMCRPPAAALVAALAELLAGSAVTRPDVPFGREDFPLRLPLARVAKWKTWLGAVPA